MGINRATGSTHRWRNVGAQTTGTLQASLRYDLGRLYEVVGSSTTRFLYDGDALVGEYDTSSALLRRYAHGNDLGADDPAIWFEGTSAAASNARYLYADPRGSIVLTGDASGNALAINTYDEYGIPGSANQGRFQYTGQAWIAELGMYHYKARIYSPTLGRFLQADPVGYDDQVNLYAYVGNDPVNGTDPTGEFRGLDAMACADLANMCGTMDSAFQFEQSTAGKTAVDVSKSSASQSENEPVPQNGDDIVVTGARQSPAVYDGPEIVVTGVNPNFQLVGNDSPSVPRPRVEGCITFSHLCMAQPGNPQRLMRECQQAERLCNAETWERRMDPANDRPPFITRTVCLGYICYSIGPTGMVRAYDKRYHQ